MHVPVSLPTSCLALPAFLIILLLLTSTKITLAQEFERVIDAPPVSKNGVAFELPFFGGLDQFLPQFIDIDGDDDLDLFIALNDGRLTLLENQGTPAVPRYFPITEDFQQISLRSWFYFVDIDADGDYDLYHDNGSGGLTFHRNRGSRTVPEFELEAETVLQPDGQPVFSEVTSLPAFADIDADGDYDFFTGVSTGTIMLYRNVGSPLEPSLSFETEKWQDLLIFSFGKVQSGTTPFASTWLNNHGASGIEFVDLDHDGDQDFFYGDFFHPSAYFLRNEGTPQAAVVAITDTLFPPPLPVRTKGYNIPRFADIDGDGDTDMFVASQLQTTDNFLFYQNIGSATAPILKLATVNYLSMLDVGSNATPALADIDADGDLDLFLGNIDGALIFYENRGTAAAASFHWMTDRYQGISLQDFTTTPTFADIDDDGDLDLFIGSFFGRIAFFENRGNASAPSFVQVTTAFQGIDVGNASAPQFADGDQDGDLDLFIGVDNRGAVHIYENLGSKTAPSFEFRKKLQHNVPVDDALPFPYDWNRDGLIDLFIGQRNGTMLYYEGAGLDSFRLVTAEFAGIDVGQSNAPVIADLDGDGRRDFIIGERGGGLNFFRGLGSAAVADDAPTPREFTLSAYPNPVQRLLNIVLQSEAPVSASPVLALYDVTGRQITSLGWRAVEGHRWLATIDMESLQLHAGVYFLRAASISSVVTHKVVVVR